MIKLAPSILSADFANLGQAIKTIEEAGAEYAHIDVMDGHFVPNITMGPVVVGAIRPFGSLVFDVHLMIEQPEQYIADFAKAGADLITVHAEACSDIDSVLKCIREQNIKAGLSIKPATPAEVVVPYLDQLDLVLVMSVEPGFGGQKLIPESLLKAEFLAGEIKRRRLQVEIEMDGGIYLDNVKEVLESGVNVVVAGSAVYGAKEPSAAVEEFKSVFRRFEAGQ